MPSLSHRWGSRRLTYAKIFRYNSRRADGSMCDSPTGIVLDPVYSGKALYNLLEEMREAPDEWRGRRVMFLHTGGLLGMYDKLSQLEPIIERTARASRLKVDT